MRVALLRVLLLCLSQFAWEAAGQVVDSYQVKQVRGGAVATERAGFLNYVGPEYSYLQDSPLEKALDSLNKSQLNGLDATEFYYYRSWVYFLHGKIPESFADADRYSKLPSRKNTYGGLVLLAKLYALRLSPAKSEELYNQAIALDPGRIDAYVEKARVYAFRSEVEMGLAEVKQLVKKFPDAAEPYLYRGILLTRNQDYKKGYADLTKVLEARTLSPTDKWQANYWAAKSCLGLKNDTVALRYAQQCLKIDPGRSEGYGLRGEAYFRAGDLDSALADFNRMEQGFQSSYYWEIIAAIHEKKGNVKEACRYLSKSCQMFPTQGNACSRLKKLCGG